MTTADQFEARAKAARAEIQRQSDEYPRLLEAEWDGLPAEFPVRSVIKFQNCEYLIRGYEREDTAYYLKVMNEFGFEERLNVDHVWCEKNRCLEQYRFECPPQRRTVARVEYLRARYNKPEIGATCAGRVPTSQIQQARDRGNPTAVENNCLDYILSGVADSNLDRSEQKPITFLKLSKEVLLQSFPKNRDGADRPSK